MTGPQPGNLISDSPFDMVVWLESSVPANSRDADLKHSVRHWRSVDALGFMALPKHSCRFFLNGVDHTGGRHFCIGENGRGVNV